jgi:hypothetical protein
MTASARLVCYLLRIMVSLVLHKWSGVAAIKADRRCVAIGRFASRGRNGELVLTATLRSDVGSSSNRLHRKAFDRTH